MRMMRRSRVKSKVAVTRLAPGFDRSRNAGWPRSIPVSRIAQPIFAQEIEKRVLTASALIAGIERSSAISVRGEYTAAALAHHGIKNSMVTGCPSLLWNGTPLRVAKPARAPTRLAVSATRSDLYEKVFDPAPPFRVSLLLSRPDLEWSPALVEESVDALLRGWTTSPAAPRPEQPSRGTS